MEAAKSLDLSIITWAGEAEHEDARMPNVHSQGTPVAVARISEAISGVYIFHTPPACRSAHTGYLLHPAALAEIACQPLVPERQKNVPSTSTMSS
jgi:hypothetical protein